MKEFTITKSLYDWTVKISGKTVSVSPSHVEMIGAYPVKLSPVVCMFRLI